MQHLDKVDEVGANDVEIEDETQSEDEQEIESASDDEDAGDEEDGADDVSENCSEKDDEPLEFNEDVEGMEPNSEKQPRSVIFSLLFSFNCCYRFSSAIRD